MFLLQAVEPVGVKIIKLPDAPYFGNVEILQGIAKEILNSVKKQEGNICDEITFVLFSFAFVLR